MAESVLSIALVVLALSAASLAGFVWWRARRRRRPAKETSSPLSGENLRRLQGRLRALVPLIPKRASLTYRDFPAHEAAAAIEAWLLQQKPRNALAAAYLAVRAEPRDWRVRLHLARTLFYCDEMEAAAQELVKARLLGDTSPAQDYLEARIRLASTELSLQSDAREPEEMERRLRLESAEALEMLLGVVERDPRFGDAAFHAARLAIRIGLESEGRALLEQIGPLMDVSPEREDFLLEISRLN
jgi:hypothetical protein